MNRRIVLVSALSLLSFAAYACSEAADGTYSSTNDPTNPSGSPTAAPTGTSKGSSSGATSKPSGDPAATKGVLVNELSPTKEWIEVVNSGSAPVDVSEWSVADRNQDGGGPKTSSAVKLPKGTVLAPNTYLLVQGGGPDAGDCPEGGESYCLHAGWGVSNKSGETIYLLDPSEKVLESVDYPPLGVAKGESFGRIPSGDPAGVFQANVPTPGAANQAK